MDGRFIQKLGMELNNELQSGRVQKIYQLSKTDFLFMVRTPGKTRQLYISLSTSLTRIHLTNMQYDKYDAPGGFCMLLRKYLEGGVITHIFAANNDRIVAINIENRNDFGELITYFLYMEILGRYANLIVTDRDHKIIDAYKHVSPFEGRERTIERGATYKLPDDGKINPDDTDGIRKFLDREDELTVKEIVNNIRGFSPLLARHFLDRLEKTDAPAITIYLELMNEKPEPTLFSQNDKTNFYYLDVFPPGDKIHHESLSELLDVYFSVAGRQERNRQIARHLIQFVRRELERNTNKLENLAKDMDQAKQADIYRIKGDMLLEHQQEISRGQNAFTAFSYEQDKQLSISLDPLLTAIQNANKYFHKYRKFKNSIPFINEQVRLTKTEIEYFSLLASQIENAESGDLEEIRQELMDLGYLKRHPGKPRRKLPNYEIFIDAEGIEILVGKNNIQNDYITHKLAKPNEWWFHTKEHHGAHVVIRSDSNLQASTIRTAANLAACYSQARLSASVPVDYTRIRYVKKIPKMHGSFVTYANQRTIYIDPDPKLIDNLERKKSRT